MLSWMNVWIVVALLVPVLLSLRSPRRESQTEIQIQIQTQPKPHSQKQTQTLHLPSSSSPSSNSFFNERIRDGSNLDYDFYKDTCPQAEDTVRSAVTRIFFDSRDSAPAILRLFFHDCFIQGCDASVLLDDSNGDKNHSIEKQAVPNQTLRGFDEIDLIKEEVEQACPGVVSCADILAIAARDFVILAGGPFYPVLTGRRDSNQSFYEEANDQIPRPGDNVSRTLRLFSLRGFNERETVSLLGGHNIGKIGCEFIQERIYNFQGTGQADPSIPVDFLNQVKLNCPENDTILEASTFEVSKLESSHSDARMSYMQALSSSIPSGAAFDTHYYQSLLKGRGLLFADQQLMSHAKTARLVSAYASDDGSTFRMDFARVMLKLSNLDVLTGLQGQVRLNCSQPVSS